MYEQDPRLINPDIAPINDTQLTVFDTVRDFARNVLHNKFVAPAAAVALSGLLTACGGTKEAPTAAVHSSTSTTPSTGTPNVAPTATNTPSETVPTTSSTSAAVETGPTFSQETIDAYRQLPIEQFNQLPRETRLMVVWDTYYNVENSGILVEFMQQTMHDGRALYNENPAKEGNAATTTDDGQKMLMQQNFGEAVAAAFKKDQAQTGDGPLDFNGAQQMLSGFIYNVGKADTSGLYDENIANLEQIAHNGNGGAAQLPGLDKMLTLETDNAVTSTDEDGQKEITRSYVYNVGDGNTYRVTAVLQSFTDKDGQPHSLWLIKSQSKVKFEDSQVNASK